MLVNRGYICIECASTGGRPSETIWVNPKARDIADKVSEADYSLTLDTLCTINLEAELTRKGDPMYTTEDITQLEQQECESIFSGSV